MLFVIQVVSRTENEIISRIKKAIDPKLYSDVFVVNRERLKKEDKKWIKYEERCFPGYIFLESDSPKEFGASLRQIEGFARVVSFGSNENRSFVPLSEEEEKVIYHLIGKDKTIELSVVDIEEGKNIRVISGPLEGFEGRVLKYDLHKRVCKVELDLGGIKNMLQLGIDVIEKKED